MTLYSFVHIFLTIINKLNKTCALLFLFSNLRFNAPVNTNALSVSVVCSGYFECGFSEVITFPVCRLVRDVTRLLEACPAMTPFELDQRTWEHRRAVLLRVAGAPLWALYRVPHIRASRPASRNNPKSKLFVAATGATQLLVATWGHILQGGGYRLLSMFTPCTRAQLHH
jgi:hypothetical protein